MEVLSLVMYHLALPPSWQLHNTFHTLLLSPYYKTAEYRVGYSMPTPDLINGEPEWEVKAVLALRCFGRQYQLQYLIKWKGYPMSENSWEPTEHLQTPDLLEEFYKIHPEAVKSINIGRTQPIQGRS
jgi:hypothetical protein